MSLVPMLKVTQPQHDFSPWGPRAPAGVVRSSGIADTAGERPASPTISWRRRDLLLRVGGVRPRRIARTTGLGQIDQRDPWCRQRSPVRTRKSMREEAGNLRHRLNLGRPSKGKVCRGTRVGQQAESAAPPPAPRIHDVAAQSGLVLPWPKAANAAGVR